MDKSVENNQELMTVVLGLMQKTDQMIDVMGSYHKQFRNILAMITREKEQRKLPNFNTEVI